MSAQVLYLRAMHCAKVRILVGATKPIDTQYSKLILFKDKFAKAFTHWCYHVVVF